MKFKGYRERLLVCLKSTLLHVQALKKSHSQGDLLRIALNVLVF